MDVEQLAGGAQAVRGIDVTAVFLVEIEAPVALIVVPELIEIVDVGTLDVEDLAEKPVLRHVERRQLEEIVDTVLEHHAVALRLLGGVHQLPALVERLRGGNLDGDVLAVLHGIDRHRNMLEPRRGDVDQVDVLTLAELLPALLAAVGLGTRQAALLEDLLRSLDPLGIEVAQRLDLHAVEVRETADGTRTAHTQPDETDADGLHGLGPQAKDRLLPRLALRSIEDDHAIDGRPTLVRIPAAAGRKQHARQGTHQNAKFLHRKAVNVIYHKYTEIFLKSSWV